MNNAKVSIRDKEAFVEMKDDFDNILKRTLISLTGKDGNSAEITMKLKISIDKSCIKSFTGGNKDEIFDVKPAYKPSFEHKLTSVIQTKDSIEGKMHDEVALIWDNDLGEFVLRPLDENEQLTIDFLGSEYENTRKSIENRQDGYTYYESGGVVECLQFPKKIDDENEAKGDSDEEYTDRLK